MFTSRAHQPSAAFYCYRDPAPCKSSLWRLIDWTRFVMVETERFNCTLQRGKPIVSKKVNRTVLGLTFLRRKVLVGQDALQDRVGPHAVIPAQSVELGQLGDAMLLQRTASKLNTGAKTPSVR